MDAVGAAASLLALIELAAKTTSICVKYSVAVKNANKDIKRLQDEVGSLTNVLQRAQQLYATIDNSKLTASKEIVASINACSSQLDKLNEKLKPAKRSRLASTLKFNELKWPLESKHVEKTVSELERYKSTISLCFDIDQTAILQDMLTGLELDKLPTAAGAVFDSFSDQLDPTCHKETRKELLQHIRDWIHDSTSKCIFWLNGAAGYGKSTIARTIAEEYSKKGLLGASFFFKRGEGDRGKADRLITTIASQLVRSIPALTSCIRKAIEAEPGISGKSIREQFVNLILQPLKEISTKHKEPLVIVIDALDECENLDHIKLLIQLLADVKSSDGIDLRCFLTSRPELPIRLGFQSISGTSYQGIVLHEISKLIIRSDITVYLRDELSNIQLANTDQLAIDWPGKQKLEQLVSIAEPLFISAATICRFVSDERFDPDEQLGTILQYQHIGQTDQLAATYQPILDSLLQRLNKGQRNKLVSEFQEVVGTIVVAADTLSVVSLAMLLNLPTNLIERRLSSLHSVLDIPSDLNAEIRLFHLSFRDYLVDEARRDQPFSIDEPEMHNRIAHSCLQLLANTETLKQDICGLGKPGMARKNIDSNLLSSCLPSAVEYACKYWVYHLQQASYSLMDGDEVQKFLEKRFLYWLEALALIGRAYEALNMITVLLQLRSSTKSTSILSFLNDAKDFASAQQRILDSAPLQIYSAGLLFTSKSSNIRLCFDSQLHQASFMLPQIHGAWDGIVHRSGHTQEIRQFDISPDLRQFASASADNTAKLWNTATGELQHTLNGHEYGLFEVTFSWDGNHVATTDYSGVINIWSTAKGTLIKTISSSFQSVSLLTFSKYHHFLLVGLFENDNANPVKLFEGAEYFEAYTISLLKYPIQAQFCPSGNRIALLNPNYDVTIICRQTGRILLNFTDCVALRYVNDFRFSPDGDLLAVLYKDESAKILYTTTGDLNFSVGKSERGQILSPSGRMLATFDHSGNLHVWDTFSNQVRFVLDSFEETHNYDKYGMRTMIVFSQHENLLALRTMKTGSRGPSSHKNITIWDTKTGHLKHAFDDIISTRIESSEFPIHDCLLIPRINNHESEVWACPSAGPRFYDVHSRSEDRVVLLNVSPDGRLLLSSKVGMEVLELWNMLTCSLQATLQLTDELGHIVGFSSDGLYLAFTIINRRQRQQMLQVWKTGTMELHWTTAPLEGWVQSSEFSSNGKWVAASCMDGRIRIWNTFTGELEFNLDPGRQEPWNICITRNNSHILWYYGGEMGCWSMSSGSSQTLIDRRTGLSVRTPSIYHAISSADGNLILIKVDESFELIDIRKNSVQAIEGIRQLQTNACWVGDKVIAFYLPEDGMIAFWNVTTSKSEWSVRTDAETPIRVDADRLCQMEWDKINPNNQQSRDRNKQEYFLADQWLTINGEKILWLPPSYRPTRTAYTSSKIVMGFASGRILMFDNDASGAGTSNWLR